jgi:hypothetical protein
MSGANRPRRWRGPITLFCESRHFRWSAIVGLILVLYVLSVGPAFWLATRGFLPKWAVSLIGTVYMPLGWAAGMLPRVGQAILWYTEYWDR